jgi:hypothetical protein
MLAVGWFKRLKYYQMDGWPSINMFRLTDKLIIEWANTQTNRRETRQAAAHSVKIDELQS